MSAMNRQIRTLYRAARSGLSRAGKLRLAVLTPAAGAGLLLMAALVFPALSLTTPGRALECQAPPSGAGEQASPSRCDAHTCPNGCCSGLLCMPGASIGECGANGAACADCGFGHYCDNQECVAVCETRSCWSGCCSGTDCLPGNTDANCGGYGMACVTCNPASQHCANQRCVAL
jgi:hypothetical protein